MATTSTLLKLSFKTDNIDDKKASFSVRQPKLNLNNNDVQTAMDAIITSGILNQRVGSLTARNSARLVTTTTTDITLPV